MMIYRSPVGVLELAHCNGLLTRLEWIKGGSSFEDVPLDSFAEFVAEQLDGYFEGRRREFDIPLDLSSLTSFQRQVVEELQRTPYGERRSYLSLASAIGSPLASRAIGGALGRNPIQIIIPCHRIVPSSGGVGGYAGGVDAKRHLLELERR